VSRTRACLAIALMAFSVLSVPAVSQAAQAKHAVVSAHRGGAAYAPENTLPAFVRALQLGVDQLETDTQLTSDGQLVLMHDDTLDRTTSCTGTVLSHTLKQVQACDAGFWFTPGVGVTVHDARAAHPLRGKGVRVPTPGQLFALAKPSRASVSIEIKDIPGEANFDATGMRTAKVLVPFVQSTGMATRTVVQSFWPAALTAVHQLDASLTTQFLTSSSLGTTADQNLAFTVSDGDDISAPNSDAPDLDQTYVTAAHAAGKLFFPYTPDGRTQQRQMLTIGADGIISNFPACTLVLEGRRTEQPGDCPRELARPTAAQCAAITPPRSTVPTGSPSTTGDLRVIGIQYEQQVPNVETYASFQRAMTCLFEKYVVPLKVRGRPTLVVLNEDIGLMTIATGLRGASARAVLQSPAGGGAGDQTPAPAGALAALGQLNVTYGPQVAAYQAALGPIVPTKEVFVAATDTLARAFSQTFASAARDYGVYVIASNNQPTYRESFATADVAAYRDPEIRSGPAYVATSQVVRNTTFLWGPKDVHPNAPDGETNLLFRNGKVPLTPFEADDLMLDQGPTSGAEGIANAAGFVVAGHRLGFATSFPAFQYGAVTADPCARMSVQYMRCMDKLGVDTLIQAEANNGRWAANAGSGAWQPVEWMQSAWRAVNDPTVRFRYAVNPFMVGNLADLPFDGQSAILARDDPRAFAAHYVGAGRLEGTDPAADAPYAGTRPGFLALAPWVTPDAPRAALSATAGELAPGSGSAQENQYVQTAVYADLLPKARRGATTRPVTVPTRSLPTTGAPAAPLLLGLVLVTAALLINRLTNRGRTP
jgi:glycerophosphoryl diester phosphodiesterase